MVEYKLLSEDEYSVDRINAEKEKNKDFVEHTRLNNQYSLKNFIHGDNKDGN